MLREHREPLSVGLGALLVPRNLPVAGRDTSPIDRVSGSGLSRAWVVFEPPPPPATGGVGPRIGI